MQMSDVRYTRIVDHKTGMIEHRFALPFARNFPFMLPTIQELKDAVAIMAGDDTPARRASMLAGHLRFIEGVEKQETCDEF